ncbi:MAG: DUF3644 domain-containing protein [Nitrospira sp.]
MPKGLSQNVKHNLEKARSAALAAVEVYNRPGPRFRTAYYIVLIIIAWTALFHAIFYKRGTSPWYKQQGKNSRGDRYVRIDGDPKHWDLSECLKQYFEGNSPADRRNLEFLIGLRNKIEHRHLPELDAGLYGECQAALLNLEEMMSLQFGAQYALSEQLAVALQFSRVVPPEKKKAAKQLAVTQAKSVKEYVEKFRGSLPSSTLNSTKYSFNVFLVPKVANRKDLADTVVEFIQVDEANKDELERLEKLNILIKEKHIPITNLGLHKPGDVVKILAGKLPFKFNFASHTASWKHFKVRPNGAAVKPELTDGKYCIYDSPHKDYLYTDAWVEKLAIELADSNRYQNITGFVAVPKQ